jgi:hypothetical protein
MQILAGDTKLAGKIIGGFKPHTEIIRNAAQQKIPQTQVIVDVDAGWPMWALAFLAAPGLVCARLPGVAGLPAPTAVPRRRIIRPSS